MTSIDSYFLIGDLHSAALVSNQASIDWLCLPHFDSPSIFAKLLDNDGGAFSVDPEGFTISSYYVPETAIVTHRFQKKNNQFLLADFMLPQELNICDTHVLMRKFTGISGDTSISLHFNPRPAYASLHAALSYDPDSRLITAHVNAHYLFLPVPAHADVQIKNHEVFISFILTEGQIIELPLFYSRTLPKESDDHVDYETVTKDYWKKWIAKGSFFDVSPEALKRSAITLKLMQFYPTGAIVAAPTTSLPEKIGGSRNWDYRYVWIRDATFTLYALFVLGYKEEGERFFSFIQQITQKVSKNNFDISLMYTITGEAVPEETVLEYLSGYKDSRPVRIGNMAQEQFQLDVYGALIDAHYFITKRYKEPKEVHSKLIKQLVERIAQTWWKRDSGIWEVRTGNQHFTYSKVMAWVGVNRARKFFEMQEQEEKQIQTCLKLESDIKNWIWDHCFLPEKNILLQHPHTLHQDATNYLFVLLQFLDKHDPLTKTILTNTGNELVTADILVMRYKTDDGLPGREGSFLLCTFWLISAWAILEEVEQAQTLFLKVQSIMRDHFLLSEEIDTQTGDYLGNYPQAFSHIGFIMAAYYINRYKNRKKKQG